MTDLQKHKKQLRELRGKPRLLLHVCCGVCSVYPLIYLSRYFRVTVFFSNSNIDTYAEFQRRLSALETYLKTLDLDIKLIIDRYDSENFISDLLPYAEEKEGGKRCYQCYQKRLERTFAYAAEQGYEYCSTIMSISDRKRADYLNEIGEKLQQKYPEVKYLFADLKKENGAAINEKMNKELGLYHQNYCGCIFSKNPLKNR